VIFVAAPPPVGVSTTVAEGVAAAISWFSPIVRLVPPVPVAAEKEVLLEVEPLPETSV
jgi:hypothetical protein